MTGTISFRLWVCLANYLAVDPEHCLSLFSPCSDWPVLSDLDNMAPRYHDHLDNHRVSGKGRRGRAGRSALSLAGTEGECADREVGSPGLLQALPRGHGEDLGDTGESQPPAQGSSIFGKSWVHSPSWRWLEKRESRSTTVWPSGNFQAQPWAGLATYMWAAMVGGRGLLYWDLSLTAQSAGMLSGWINRTGSWSFWVTQW